jgi:hypothetical protein
MSQKHEVLTHLKQGNTITSYEAFTNWGITRISAVIHLLKSEGYPIVREDIDVITKDGRKTTIGQWSLTGIRVLPLQTQLFAEAS